MKRPCGDCGQDLHWDSPQDGRDGVWRHADGTVAFEDAVAALRHLRPLTSAIQHDIDSVQSVPVNGALVAWYDEGQATDFNVLTYWHQPTNGPGYVVVEIEDMASDSPNGGPLTPVRVRHNETSVYTWRVMKGVADVMRDHGLVNGLRTDLHEPNCPGMDEDGNWLGPCDCAKQHEGMPPIIYAGEASDQWASTLNLNGYNVRLVVTDPAGVPSPVEGRTQVTVIGPVIQTGRGEDGFAYLEILLDHYGPGTGHAARFSSEEITSIYIY